MFLFELFEGDDNESVVNSDCFWCSGCNGCEGCNGCSGAASY